MPTAMTRIAVARIRAFAPALFVFTLPGLSCAVAQPSALGFFDGQTDVGHNASRGDAGYNAATNTYTLTSNGANTWYHVDNFHFVWKKTSGDQTLTADIRFPSPAYTHEPNPHRKGILMFRQTLDAGAAYVALGAHGLKQAACGRWAFSSARAQMSLYQSPHHSALQFSEFGSVGEALNLPPD